MRFPAIPETRRDATAAVVYVALACLIAANALRWALDPRYTSTLSEYLVKFLPAFADGGIAAAFDVVGMGDPRPRIVSNLLALMNVNLRQLAIANDAFWPALGVNWIIYPLGFALLYSAIVVAWGSRRIAATAALLYAASPGAVDVLCNYYVPAKPLANLSIVAALYFFAKALPAPGRATRVASASAPIAGGLALTAGLFSDETAIFAYLLVPAVLAGNWGSATPTTRRWIGAASMAPLLVYAAVALWLLPLLNNALAQAPVDFWAVATQGIYSGVFQITLGSPPGSEFSYSPVNLVETILSAHTVPARDVPGIWTGYSAWGFADWSVHEKLSILLFCGAIGILAFSLPDRRRREARWVLGSFLLFSLLQAALIRPLASVLLEVNYYGSASSIWFGVLGGLLIGAEPRLKRLAEFRVVLLAYLVIVLLTNFEGTVRRHPYWSDPAPTPADIEEIRRKVKEGRFGETVGDYPFPDRRFFWAYEMEVARRVAVSVPVDLYPRRNPNTSIISLLPVTGTQDGRLRDADVIPEIDEDDMRADSDAAEVGVQHLRSLLLGARIRGQAGPWRFIRHISAAGLLDERVWYEGLARQWRLTGRLAPERGELCAIFQNGMRECLARVYITDDGTYHGYSRDGMPVCRFRIIVAAS